MRRWSLALILLLLLSGQGLATLPAQEWESDSDKDLHRWLLKSPARQYLSATAERYLYLRYGPEALHGEDGDDLRALDQIINDRAQDTIPSLTEQNEATIEVSGSHLVAGWNDDGQYLSTLSLTAYAYSTNGGRTWRDGGVIPPIPGGLNIGDPEVKADRQGNFYFATLAIRPDGVSIVGVSKSTNGGKTFSVPVQASVGLDPADFQDKEFMAIDNTGGTYDGTIYVTWTDFFANPPPAAFNQIVMARSTNGGRSFMKAIPVSPPGGFQDSIPRVGPQGELYVLYVDYDVSGLRLSKSTDGGRTFGADGLDNTLIARFQFIGTPNLNCGRTVLKGDIRVGQSPSLAVNPTNGDVYVVYESNPPGPDQADVYFIRSTDGGVTWSEPLKISDDRTRNDQFFPFLAVSPDGIIGVSFNDRRNDPANLKYDKYLAVSRDGGRTFEPNIRMNSVASPIPPVETYDNCYMGDYDQIVADEQFFYAAWGDNRNPALTWRTEARMPRPREGTVIVGVGDAVLAIGGYYTDLPTVVDTGINEAYLPSMGRWVSLSPDPVARANAAAVGLGLFAYVAGGRSLPSGDVLASFTRYDALTNSWTRLPSMPTARAGLGLAVVGNKIYAIGGRDCSLYVACGKALDANEAYDLKTGRWETKAPMPTPRMDLAVVALDDKIYALGGYNPDQGALSDVEVYDPATDTWTLASSLPARRISGGAAVCGEKIVYFGGYTPSYAPSVRVWIYDSMTEEWEFGPFLKVARAEVHGSVAADQLFAIGGSYAEDPRYAGYNEAFSCKTMGAFRPDPDVFFAKIPVSPPSVPLSSSKTSTAATPTLQSLTHTVDALGKNVITFSAQGWGIAMLEVKLFDLSGRQIAQKSARGNRLKIPLGNVLANGVYLYVITARAAEGSALGTRVEKLVLLH